MHSDRLDFPLNMQNRAVMCWFAQDIPNNWLDLRNTDLCLMPEDLNTDILFNISAQ